MGGGESEMNNLPEILIWSGVTAFLLGGGLWATGFFMPEKKTMKGGQRDGR